jgi:hypothetical protein
MDGIPGTGFNQNYIELAEVVDAKVTLKGANPFGEVTDGYITIRAPMEQLFLITEDWDPETKPWTNLVKARTAKGEPKGSNTRFDFPFASEDAPKEAKRIVKSLEGVDIFALALVKTEARDPKDGNDGNYQSLIVRRAEDGNGFQRLGFIWGDSAFMGRRLEDQPKEQLPLVTLV